jgi:hypothetical protein
MNTDEINPIIFAEVSIGYTTVEALEAALPKTVSARTVALGSRIPGWEVLPAVPPAWRFENLASARFLHWRARCNRTPGPAHARRRSLSQLFSYRRNPGSRKTATASTVQRPARAVRALEVFVGLGCIGHAAGRGVVFQSLPRPVRHQAEQHLLDHRAGVVEVTMCF